MVTAVKITATAVSTCLTDVKSVNGFMKSISWATRLFRETLRHSRQGGQCVSLLMPP